MELDWLKKNLGCAVEEKREAVNHKRVRRLMREMGLEAIYPKPRRSHPGEGQLIYLYLLGGLPIVRPNQVWGADITYIRLAQGFVYLVRSQFTSADFTGRLKAADIRISMDGRGRVFDNIFVERLSATKRRRRCIGVSDSKAVGGGYSAIWVTRRSLIVGQMVRST